MIDTIIFGFYDIDAELLEFLETIKDVTNLYIFTGEEINNDPGLVNILMVVFKEIFTTTLLGFESSDPQAYQELANRVGGLPEEILYISKNQAELDIAEKVGFNVLKYENNDQLYQDFAKISFNL